MAFNKVILIGNLVADPELKTTQTGISVCRFSIAVSRKAVKSGEQPVTDFFNIVAWRQTAEFISRFFTKGKAILVCGSLQNRNWVGNDGQKHYSTEIVADEVTFVERKGDSAAPAAQSPAPSMPSFSTPSADSGFEDLSADDELPF
ncbi:MAG: single-stranded DNA-binding protein [Clostridiales bacterium]|nr:single-stranded DNA-binding protein [Candidatus Coliplasma equi]